MSERTAAEILLAQLDHDVLLCKRDVLQQMELADFPARPALADALETLAEKACMRWWIGRMAGQDHAPRDPAANRERMEVRAKVLGMCVQRMVERSGPIDANALQMSVLGISADVNALWGALIEAGMVTPEMRQQYLDQSVTNTYQRIEDYSQKIILANSPLGRAQ